MDRLDETLRGMMKYQRARLRERDARDRAYLARQRGKKRNVFGFQPDADKWRRHRINKRFLKRLLNIYGATPFGLPAAYKHYMKNHAVPDYGEQNIKDPLQWDTGWRKMNVRNHLSAAAFRGLLVRVGPGRYRFTKKGIHALVNIDA